MDFRSSSASPQVGLTEPEQGENMQNEMDYTYLVISMKIYQFYSGIF